MKISSETWNVICIDHYQFLDSTGEYILCGIHGARFRIHDGYCIAGPCAGCSLTKVGVAVQQGRVLTGKGLQARRD